MIDLISKRQILLKFLDKSNNGDLLSIIRDMPSMNVVQCSECKWYYCYHCRYHYDDLGLLLAKTPDEFCSDGEEGVYE